MNKRTKFTIGIVVGIVVLLAIPKLKPLFEKKEIAEIKPGASKLPVEGLIIKEKKLDRVLVVTGSVLPNESLELTSESSGKITGLYFKEGKQVKRGDLLVQINDTELKAELDKARHNQKLNEDIEKRQRALLAKDAISQEEYDNALNRLNTTSADIRVLEAQLDKMKIVAPFDGVIGLRYISDGAYINTSTAIATLYNIQTAKVEFSIPGRYSALVKPGQKIRFSIENDVKPFNGEVYAIEPRIDPATRTLKIRAMADNRGGDLLPGQFVKIELIFGTVPKAIMAPTEAVIPEMGGNKVFIKRGGKALEVKVETGIRTEKELEIVAGLQAGDTLITTGMLQLRNGLEVSVTKIVE